MTIYGLLTLLLTHPSTNQHICVCNCQMVVAKDDTCFASATHAQEQISWCWFWIKLKLCHTYLQDNNGKRWDDNDALHLSNRTPEGRAMLVLFQHGPVVLPIAWIMGKEVIEKTQGKTDDANCQEHHSPSFNDKRSVSACTTDRLLNDDDDDDDEIAVHQVYCGQKNGSNYQARNWWYQLLQKATCHSSLPKGMSPPKQSRFNA